MSQTKLISPALIISALTVSLLAVNLASQDSKPSIWLKDKARQAQLKKIEKAMAGISSVAATFEQEKHLSLFESTAKSSGIILFRRPDHLRWEIQKPFRSLLIVTGNKVAKFQFVEGKRKRLELGKSGDLILMVMDRIRDWFRGKFDDSSGLYHIDIAAKPRPIIRMRPRNKSLQSNLSSIEVLLSPSLSSVQQVTINETAGDKTVMRFTEVTKKGDPVLGYFDPKNPRTADLKTLKTDPLKTDPPKKSPKKGKK